MQPHTQDVQHQDEATRAPGPAAKRRGMSPFVVGLAMLLLGILVGNLIRPLMSAEYRNAASTTSARASPPTGQTALMEAVIAQTRHFTGDPNAPITIIEFGDFQ